MIRNRMFNPMEVGLFNVSDFFVPQNTDALSNNPLEKKYYPEVVPCHINHSNGHPLHVRITKVAQRIFSSITDSELDRIEISKTGCVTFVTKNNPSKIRFIAGRVSMLELAECEILWRG